MYVIKSIKKKEKKKKILTKSSRIKKDIWPNLIKENQDGIGGDLLVR